MGAQMKNTNHESKQYSLLASSREVIRPLTPKPKPYSITMYPAGRAVPRRRRGVREVPPAAGLLLDAARAPQCSVASGCGEMGHFVKMAAATDRFTKRARENQTNYIGLSLVVP